jgi:arylsulfatase
MFVRASTVIRRHLFPIAALALAALLASCHAALENAELEKHSAQSGPNFLVIVVDDLGFSDLSLTGSEIHTPNIDKLASDGLFLTNFYAGGTCSPTRAMLLSGIDHHQAGVGTMMEHIAPNQVGQPGYEGYLNERVVALPQLLQEAGYQTYAAGKWHLGMTAEHAPDKRGFDRSFMLLNGGASHFDGRGLNAKTDPAPYREDGKLVPVPDDYDYSTDFYTRRMIDYIESGRASGKPFFGYLAYTAPHWPLQAPAEDIAKYKGVYDAGWQAIQQQRLERMQASGLMPESAVVHPIYTASPPWSELSAEQRAVEAKRMEIFAAMVDRLDQQIGVLIDYLKRTGQYDDTVIIFLSDNGAEGAPLYEKPPFQAYMNSFDNSLDNMGKRNSYVFYEERWAQTSMTPFRLYKGMASEGGIHVPAFVTYAGIKAAGRNPSLTHVTDIAPTILEMAGVAQPSGTWQGKSVLPIQGKSWLPVLENQTASVRSGNEGLGSELFNKRSYRIGNWKALHLHEPFGPGRWELFDLSRDPGETNDLSVEYPEKLAELVASWEEYARLNGVVLGNTPPER